MSKMNLVDSLRAAGLLDNSGIEGTIAGFVRQMKDAKNPAFENVAGAGVSAQGMKNICDVLLELTRMSAATAFAAASSIKEVRGGGDEKINEFFDKYEECFTAMSRAITLSMAEVIGDNVTLMGEDEVRDEVAKNAMKAMSKGMEGNC